MMSGLFLKIFNLSISAGWLIIAVLILRLLLKKAPKWVNCVLWSIVGIRLIMPFSLESVFSLIPSAETITKSPVSPRPHFESGVSIVDNRVNEYLKGHYFEGVSKPNGYFADVTYIISIIWIIGMILLLGYTFFSFFRLKNKIGTAVLLKDNIYQSENVSSPFVLGIFKPKIFLPYKIDNADLEHIVSHEKAHIKRKDHLWKPFGFLLVSLYWFNPLMWLGYIILCRDIELACDEKVIRNFDRTLKADYSQALLKCSINKRMITVCPLAFGEVGVKERVKSVLNYKKPAFWIVLIAIIASIAVAICFLTDPPKTNETDGISNQKSESDLNGISLKVISCDLTAPDPFLEIQWTNETDYNLLLGEQFSISKDNNGAWENCSIDSDPLWHLTGLILNPNSSASHVYKLNGQNMSEEGKYLFEAKYKVQELEDIEFSAKLEFTLEKGVELDLPAKLSAVELVYCDPVYSYVQNVEGFPFYVLANNMQLLEKANDSEYNIFESIGYFEEVTLSNNTFDSRFRFNDSGWTADETLKSLKSNNRRIWDLHCDITSDYYQLYLLLEQKDGTFYLGYGYYNQEFTNDVNPDNSSIRWLYRLNTPKDYNGSQIVIPGDPNAILTAPPDLIITSNEQCIKGLCVVYSWSYKDENLVDRESFLQRPIMTEEGISDKIPIVDILPSYYSIINPLDVKIQFNEKDVYPINTVIPDELKVACIDTKELNVPNALFEDIPVTTVNGNLYFQLKDGNYLYEITAVWNTHDEFSGKVSYYFLTNSPNLQY